MFQFTRATVPEKINSVYDKQRSRTLLALTHCSLLALAHCSLLALTHWSFLALTHWSLLTLTHCTSSYFFMKAMSRGESTSVLYVLKTGSTLALNVMYINEYFYLYILLTLVLSSLK